MRVLHEIHCPLHCVDLRFSREEFYLCDHHNSYCRIVVKGVLYVKKCLYLSGFGNVPDLTYD